MKYLHILALSAAIIGNCGHADAKRAILAAHYGSSDDSTRTATINLIASEIALAMPGYEVREAYISPVVRRNMTARGLEAYSPQEALRKLRADGFDTVYVQPTTLLEGMETAEVRAACHSMEHTFGLLKCGDALCHTPDDCLALASVLLEEPADPAEAVVYAGHGNMLPGTATYSQLDYMLSIVNGNYHVSTIEGYPTNRTTLTKLRNSGRNIEKVKIVPLLLVCGNHTRYDIAGDFARTFSEAGYTTNVLMRGLGEVPAARALYLDRVRALVSE